MLQRLLPIVDVFCLFDNGAIPDRVLTKVDALGRRYSRSFLPYIDRVSAADVDAPILNRSTEARIFEFDRLFENLHDHANRAVNRALAEHARSGRITYRYDRGRVVAVAASEIAEAYLSLFGSSPGFSPDRLVTALEAYGVPSSAELVADLLEGFEVRIALPRDEALADLQQVLTSACVHQVRLRHHPDLDDAPRLEDWRIILVDGDPHLVGKVCGHPHLRNAARAVTTQLLWISNDLSAARTRSRLYELGVPGEGPLPEDWASAVDLSLALGGAKRSSPS